MGSSNDNDVRGQFNNKGGGGPCCGFCGKGVGDVGAMVQGGTSTICDSCAKLAVEQMAEQQVVGQFDFSFQ